MTHQGAAQGAAGVHFRPSRTKTDIFVILIVVISYTHSSSVNTICFWFSATLGEIKDGHNDKNVVQMFGKLNAPRLYTAARAMTRSCTDEAGEATSWPTFTTQRPILLLSSHACYVVRCVMGDSKRYCANWSKSMKFGTLIDFHMLYPNLPGAKANFQWCHHLARFKMAACQKQIFPLCVKEM